jgi:hypothetical protein
VAVSVLAWFVPDTVFSSYAGFWKNALLNLGFFGLFALGLWFARGVPTAQA